MGISQLRHVFINCPFDPQYQSLFEAIIFAVSVCGFRPRCALEADDGSQIRIEEIFNINDRSALRSLPQELPSLCQTLQISTAELTFIDFTWIVKGWLDQNP